MELQWERRNRYALVAGPYSIAAYRVPDASHAGGLAWRFLLWRRDPELLTGYAVMGPYNTADDAKRAASEDMKERGSHA